MRVKILIKTSGIDDEIYLLKYLVINSNGNGTLYQFYYFKWNKSLEKKTFFLSKQELIKLQWEGRD